MNADTISMLYAEYATYFMSIINIPLTLSSAAPTSMIPEVSALYATGDIDETRRRVDQTVQLSMFISIPLLSWHSQSYLCSLEEQMVLQGSFLCWVPLRSS